MRMRRHSCQINVEFVQECRQGNGRHCSTRNNSSYSNILTIARVKETAAAQIEEFQAKGLEDLPRDIKAMLQSANDNINGDNEEKITGLSNVKQTTVSKLSKLVLGKLLHHSNSEKLDKFLVEFTLDLKKALSVVLVGADNGN